LPRPLGEALSTSPDSAGTITPRSISGHSDIPRATVVASPTLHQLAMAGVDEPHRPGGVTFAHQDELPHLPIPELADTCRRYLAALKPIQGLREHSETRHAVQDFLKHHGPDLQEKLKKYAEDRTSYIEQFCAFLGVPHPRVEY
jgi:carnitine O-acetyltransferase